MCVFESNFYVGREGFKWTHFLKFPHQNLCAPHLLFVHAIVMNMTIIMI